MKNKKDRRVEKKQEINKENKEIKKKLDINKLIFLSLVVLAALNILLSFILTNVQTRHDSISHYGPDFNEANVRNYNLKREIKNVKELKELKKIKEEENKSKNKQNKKS